MEPFSIVGAAGAIIGIVDVVTRTINSLRELHDRWKDADLTIINLMSQLTALRAALNKIAEWVSSDLAGVPQHHQLVMDLEDSVTCCRVLMKSVNEQLIGLDWDDGTLDLGSKIRVVFNSKASNDFQTFIQRQTSALTLLLMACVCKTTSEQTTMLERPDNRQILEQVKKDSSSSMIVLQGSSSFISKRTWSTENSSKMSIVFPGLDAELWSTPVYQRAVRSLFKRPLTRHKETQAKGSSKSSIVGVKSELKEQALKSESIDSTLKKDRKNLAKTVNIAVMGGCNGAMDAFWTILNGKPCSELDDEERLLYRTRILSIALQSVRYMLEDPHITMPDTQKSWTLLAQKCSRLLSREEVALRLAPVPFYFFYSIHRVASPSFVPTPTDLLYLREHTHDFPHKGISEAKISLGQLEYKFSFCFGSSLSMRKWASAFESVPTLVFLVDLPCCFRVREETQHPRDLVEDDYLNDTVAFLTNIIDSFWLRRLAFILVFCDVQAFRDQVESIPLPGLRWNNEHGGPADNALHHIITRFDEQIDQRSESRDIEVQRVIAEPKDYVQKIASAVQNIIINVNLTTLKSTWTNSEARAPTI